jgi:signal transduction histidine kinase
MNESGKPRGRILLLEDDPGIRRLERRSLERAGFAVEDAGSLAEARAFLANGAFDLLLLDYQLGEGENGLEFYRLLSEEGQAIAAILVTGFGDESRVIEAMRAGVRDFVPKTPNFVELVVPTVERVLAQVQQERRLREAEAASRAKDDFLAALSHELRTPLTPVLALVSALRKDERLDADIRGDINLIHRNISLEARLIDDLLDLTRIARGKLEVRMEPVDLVPILDHAMRTSRDFDSSGKKVSWESKLSRQPTFVQGDGARLTQVFWNVLKNAVKFTPERGTIRICSRMEERDGREWACVSVADSGIGIAAEALPRIFDAFEQGGRGITRQFGGLGLGLAISRAIVELHGGVIIAESAGLGAGATFTVRLPKLPQQQAETPGRSAPAHLNSEGVSSAHLLLVEDHTDTAVVMARMLRRAGFHVTTACSVTEALERVEQERREIDHNGRSHPIHLVVSDLGLPDGHGVDLMRQLRDDYGLRGIALSGFGMEEDVRRAREAGFATHLTKPVDFDRLLRVIQETLAEA